MSDLRRQKRKAVRESKKNFTGTKISDMLATSLDAYLTDQLWFDKQLDLCYELKMDYPPDAKSGYELPLFNKNPITNEIEIHDKSADLFASYQVFSLIVDGISRIDLDLPGGQDTYDYMSALAAGIITSPEFGLWFHELHITHAQKEKDPDTILIDNAEEIESRLLAIFDE